MKIVVHQDPGHAWFAVKRSVIDQLKLSSQISNYSYQRGKTVYLEEDCDGPLVIDALKEIGIKFELRMGKFASRSPIRSYDSYRVELS